MKDQMIFKRYELKYLITQEQKQLLLREMHHYVQQDSHGQSTILSLYFDTPDYLLIRRSIEKPKYKEKLRLRSYGVATGDTLVYMELKKKYDSVVYKRREAMPEKEAMDYSQSHIAPRDTQIFREITYAMDSYTGLRPSMLLSYDREAYYAVDDHDFRITFDENVLWRDYDLDLCKGIYGEPCIGENLVLMEIKVASAIPLWLVHILNEQKIYKTSFSKYGTAYKAMQSKKNCVNY